MGALVERRTPTAPRRAGSYRRQASGQETPPEAQGLSILGFRGDRVPLAACLPVPYAWAWRELKAPGPKRRGWCPVGRGAPGITQLIAPPAQGPAPECEDSRSGPVRGKPEGSGNRQSRDSNLGRAGSHWLPTCQWRFVVASADVEPAPSERDSCCHAPVPKSTASAMTPGMIPGISQRKSPINQGHAFSSPLHFSVLRKSSPSGLMVCAIVQQPPAPIAPTPALARAIAFVIHPNRVVCRMVRSPLFRRCRPSNRMLRRGSRVERKTPPCRRRSTWPNPSNGPAVGVEFR
jgi:hypothetical protein